MAPTKGPSENNFRNPGQRTFSSDSDNGDGLRERQNSRQMSKGRQSSVTGSKDVETLVGELNAEKKKGGEANKDAKMLAIVFVAMVFVGLGNKVFQKLMTIPLHNYSNFLNLLTTFIYLPVCFAYIVPATRSGRIPKEQAEMPKKPFFIMGALDAIAGIMQVFSATYLPGPLLILLSQAAIPVSMVISKYLLKREYTPFQYIGALIVAAGIATVLAPNISGSGSLGWSIAMIFSTVPMALSTVYKEIAVGDTELDPIFLNGWVAVFQFLFSLLFMIPAAYTSSPPVPLKELPTNLWEGLKCFGGVNSITCSPDQTPDECTPDNCYESGPLYTSIYLVFNQVYNLLIILIIKYGSSNLLFMALTVMVPLGNFAFTLPFVPGHAPLHATDIIGLVIICSGLVCYRFASIIITKYFGGSCCGYVVPIDYAPLDAAAEEGSGDLENKLGNPLLKDSLIIEEEDQDTLNRRDSDPGRYSVSKVAKKKNRAGDEDSDDGVSMR